MNGCPDLLSSSVCWNDHALQTRQMLSLACVLAMQFAMSVVAASGCSKAPLICILRYDQHGMNATHQHYSFREDSVPSVAAHPARPIDVCLHIVHTWQVRLRKPLQSVCVGKTAWSITFDTKMT